jgi:hypothetical protein
VLGEAVLINTYLSAVDLPNYPKDVAALAHLVSAEYYQRPYSFGGNASVASVILVALLAGSDLNFKKSLLPISAIISCMAGTGFFMLMIFIFKKLYKNYKILLLCFSIFSILILFSNIIRKFSIDYVFEIVWYKTSQIASSDSIKSSSDFFWGSALVGVGRYGGDFQLLSFIEINGFIGILFFLFFLLPALNRLNFLPVAILIFGSFHYGVIFSLPGQIILGYFMAQRLSFKPHQPDFVNSPK